MIHQIPEKSAFDDTFRERDNTAFAGLYYELHLSFSRKNAGLFYKILLVLSVMMASREREYTLYSLLCIVGRRAFQSCRMEKKRQSIQ